MRKLKVLLFLMVVFVSSNAAVHRAEAEKYFYDGKWRDYNAPPVSLQVGGENIPCEMPPIILNNSTLVPARTVFEKLGARVAWDGKKSQVAVTMGTTNLLLTINSNDALINGKKYQMPVPPKIINDKTMIPVRFVAEALGMKVEWVAADRVVKIDAPAANNNSGDNTNGMNCIKSIQSSLDGSTLRITVSADSKIGEYNVFELDSPARVVVDIKNSVLEQKSSEQEVKDGCVYRIRAASNSVEAGTTRIVADLKEKVGYRVTLSADGKELYMDFDNKPLPIGTIEFTKSNGEDSITVAMPYKREPVLASTGEKGKIAVDIPMASVGEAGKSTAFDGDFVKSVECTQYDPTTVRLVISTSGVGIVQMASDEKGIKLTFSPLGYKNLSYSSEGNPRLTLKNERIGLNYFNYKYSDEEDRFVLSIPQSMLNLSGRIFIYDSFIDYIDINKNMATLKTDIIFTKKSSFKYVASSVADNNAIAVNVLPDRGTTTASRGEADRNQSIKDKIVVIDPGHGGTEPGAVYPASGPVQVAEKDLNLDISLRLYELLKKAGINAYLTRQDDSTVGLYDRADLANRLDASLFVSVHNNWGGGNEHGSMTLFYPADQEAKYGISGERLAQIALEELQKNLGTANLGLWKRPKLAVLNNTKMPAIIAEIAYISDKTDRENLLNDSFRQKAAEALYSAILRALKEEAAAQKDTAAPDTAAPPVQETSKANPTSQNGEKRNINGFEIPAENVSKCEYEGGNPYKPSIFDLTIKLDYSKEVAKTATLAEQREEARQVLLSRLDEGTVNSIMDVLSQQKDMDSFFWEDEIKNDNYDIWVRCLRYTGVATVSLMKK
ncbi:MAG: N-acetylmuramoyl-L-alanine amidase [Clostridiales bacterium]|jgi:N-acetylmuramoyl-L-alanine amidase|nr:N-acetylmuramoyl-L-alanine amidase family protein [Eubacteriales bacterium]MDH7566698.1 N-acetylmuramoyl-L-alanine amidase [Clostridiales bacterium]